MKEDSQQPAPLNIAILKLLLIMKGQKHNRGYLSLTRLSLTQDSQCETGVNLIERTDHNGVHRCNENQNFEYHPLALEAIHLKLNHHRYP